MNAGAPATGAKVVKTLMCHASVLQKDRQDINADDKWPKHLIMQLIPQQVRARANARATACVARTLDHPGKYVF